jgi:hypothetical protein
VRSIDGIKIRYDRAARRPSSRPSHSEPVRPLHYGVGIRNRGPVSPEKSWMKRKTRIGTLGCFVRLKGSNERGILTSALAVGAPVIAHVGDDVVQPPSSKLAKDVVAHLQRFSNLTPSGPRSSRAAGNISYNYVDAVVATLQSEVDIKTGFGSGVRDLPQLRSSNTSEDLLNVKVFKVGAGSGLTWGQIDATDVAMNFKAWGHNYWFDGLLAVRTEGDDPFSVPNDNGALVVRDDGVVLGLLIGGSTRLSYACPIDPVLKEMGCELLLSL